MTHVDPYSVPPGALTVETITYHMQVIEDLDFIVVHAYEMTDTQFKYKCSCKNGFHCHGNGGDPFTNRIEYRSSHCQFQSCIAQPNGRSPQQVNEGPCDLEIIINDRTTRKLKKQKSKSK